MISDGGVMSISLFGMLATVALAPAILLAREAVGKETFDEWINSGYCLYKMDCNGEEEWHKIITAAGYEIEQFLGNYKTHINDEHSAFFWWQINEDSIIAELSVYDKKLNERFISAVEKYVGHKVFTLIENKKTKIMADSKKVAPLEQKLDDVLQKDNNVIFSTIYTSRDILIRTLEDYGVLYATVQDADAFEVMFDGLSYMFYRENENSPYILSINSLIQNQAAAEVLRRLTPEYTRIAQEQAYLDVIDRCKKAECEIIDEEVLEDNSVLLTISV